MTTATAPDTTETAPRSRRRLTLVVVLALVATAAAGWWFVLRPAGDEAPEPGAVVPLEAIQINLAGGHYLRLGIALQAADGAEEVEGSKALDAAIELFTGRRVADVSDPATRTRLKGALSDQVRALYDEEVLEVYFTDFVTQ